MTILIKTASVIVRENKPERAHEARPCLDDRYSYQGCQRRCPFKDASGLLPGCLFFVDPNRRVRW